MLDCENMTWKLCELAALFHFIYSFLDLSDFGAFAIALEEIHFLPMMWDNKVGICPGFCLYLTET